jgi:hypothetical protein
LDAYGEEYPSRRDGEPRRRFCFFRVSANGRLRRMTRAVVLAVMVCAGGVVAQAQDCGGLKALRLPDTTITAAEPVTDGAFAPPYGAPVEKMPAFCRVAGVLRPSADSHILFEVWMPMTGWNHELAATGNGGFAGSIYYDQIAGDVRRGYVGIGTDTGHQADAQDAGWAYRHPEKVKDFGYRGLHLTTERAKQIVAKFYGTGPEKSFFDSCSDGGREALMEAERFPEDYDGILAGAPANNWAHMVSAGLDVGKTVNADPAGYISSLKLPAISKAVLAACDAKDGVKDGILTDPRTCHFDPETLLCKDGDALNCLTAPQVRSLKKIYDGGTDSKGQVIFPGLMPGDEAGAWKSWITGDAPGMSNYVQNYFRYMVLNDPTWNGLTADVDASLQAAVANTAEALDSTSPDLSRFAARGGKLLLYHGWNDPAISPLNTIAYYQSVQAKLGTEKTSEFVRLYMVPGMEHCAGGPGPSAFGQLGIPSSVKGDPMEAFSALETWVKGGAAPTRLVATKYNAKFAVEMTRPICPYPEAPQYKGAGDTNDAASFSCAVPGK